MDWNNVEFEEMMLNLNVLIWVESKNLSYLQLKY